MFGRKWKDKIKKMDVLITSVVLGTIIAWAFWLKKKKEEWVPKNKSFLRKTFDIFLWK
jgi:hypothetical protein